MATARRSTETESAHAADQAREFGAALRQTRISQGRELADAADHLRIRKVYLQAIEEGRFDDLPGPTYAAGFVRAYADYLGLDVAEVTRRYKQSTQGISVQAQLVPPSPVAEGRLPTGSVLLVAAVLAAAAYGGWYYLSREGRDPAEVVAALPRYIADMVGMKRESVPAPAASTDTPGSMQSADTIAAETPKAAPAAPESAPAPVATVAHSAPASPTVDSAPSAQPAPKPPSAPMTELSSTTPSQSGSSAPSTMSDGLPVASSAATPLPPETASEGLASSSALAAPAPPAVPEPPPQTASTSSSAPAGSEAGRVVLRATASTWVEVRDGDGERVFSRLMRPGESYVVPPGPDVTLTTGNAGGLDIVVDGRILPPLGPAGGVRRDVALDAEALLSRALAP